MGTILGNFSNESLEGELSDQKLSRLLVSSNLSESDRSGPDSEIQKKTETSSNFVSDRNWERRQKNKLVSVGLLEKMPSRCQAGSTGGSKWIDAYLLNTSGGLGRSRLPGSL